VQGFGGAGESASSMRKSPFTSSATPAGFELCWTFPSFAQNSVANTLALPLLPTASPAPRRRPRPSSRMLPFCLTSAARSRITQIWPAAATPRTVVAIEPVGISPIPPLNLTKLCLFASWARADLAMAPMAKTMATNMPIFFTMMLNFIVLFFYLLFVVCCLLFVVSCFLFLVSCFLFQHFIARVWRDPPPLPARLGEQRTRAFDR
jgi:hypothetical protein